MIRQPVRWQLWLVRPSTKSGKKVAAEIIDEGEGEIETVTSEASDELSAPSSCGSFQSAHFGTKSSIHNTSDGVEVVASRVSFGEVTVHRHKIILGDNPSPKSGPPLSIGWEAFESTTYDVDDFESLRPQRRRGSLKLSQGRRERILKRMGFDIVDFRAAQREARLVQMSRQLSQDQIKMKGLRPLRTYPYKLKQWLVSGDAYQEV